MSKRSSTRTSVSLCGTWEVRIRLDHCGDITSRIHKVSEHYDIVRWGGGGRGVRSKRDGDSGNEYNIVIEREETV